VNLRKYLVFISGPLTHGDLTENIKNAHTAGVELIKRGFSVLIPHDTAFWGNSTLDLGKLLAPDYADKVFMTEKDIEGIAYETWMHNCFTQIKRCNALLRLPGHSLGGDREVKVAVEHGILVFYSLDELVKYFEWIERVKFGYADDLED
jgi:hypothetical protein